VFILCLGMGSLAWIGCVAAGFDLNTNLLGILIICACTVLGDDILGLVIQLLRWLSNTDNMTKMADWFMRRKEK